jgi:hypothetical protein
MRVGLSWSSWYTYTGTGRGDDTVEIDIPPAQVSVETTLYGSSGGGTSMAGIQGWRLRLSNGEDQVVDLGTDVYWVAVIYDYISAVTVGLAEGSDQQGYLMVRMDGWD